MLLIVRCELIVLKLMSQAIRISALVMHHSLVVFLSSSLSFSLPVCLAFSLLALSLFIVLSSFLSILIYLARSILNMFIKLLFSLQPDLSISRLCPLSLTPPTMMFKESFHFRLVGKLRMLLKAVSSGKMCHDICAEAERICT